MSLKAQITEDMKAAMRGGEKLRLGTIRMLLAAIKQREVDDRRELAESEVLQLIEKLIKQRREAAAQMSYIQGRMGRHLPALCPPLVPWYGKALAY